MSMLEPIQTLLHVNQERFFNFNVIASLFTAGKQQRDYDAFSSIFHQERRAGASFSHRKREKIEIH